jgi:thiamine biosynthesis lipoprotein
MMQKTDLQKRIEERRKQQKPTRNVSLIALRLTLLVVCVFIFLYARNRPGPVNPRLQGQTMGTTYSVQLVGSRLKPKALERLQATIDQRLADINGRMSMFQADSELALFNAETNPVAVRVSPELFRVVHFAWQLAEQTGGAFDPTVGPLVNLWGFGPDGRRLDVPSEDDVEAAQVRVGYQRLVLLPENQMQKKHPQMEVDLGSLAKGYAVDDISLFLTSAGYTNHLVEIGGETRVSGHNATGGLWRIGIQRPNWQALPGMELEGIASMAGGALATSGDYQNFYEDLDGQLYCHIIDPRTARPVRHKLASVTVAAPACMTADALATALYVLGPDVGMTFIEQYPHAEALFVVRDEQGGFVETASSGFYERTGYKPTAAE